MGLRVVAVTKSHYLATHPGQESENTYVDCAAGIPVSTNVNAICDIPDSSTLVTHC